MTKLLRQQACRNFGPLARDFRVREVQATLQGTLLNSRGGVRPLTFILPT
jgi:hypothetical protein